jgi:hypothetical protein
MLKAALNAMVKIHSREALIKRLGTVDTYSPCRIMPSNFFRFIRGPEHTSIKGVEFIIPVDSMLGQFSQLVTFSAIPDDGSFKLKFGSNITGDIPYNATASDIQTALRLLTPLANVIVTGSFLLGFTITFAGFSVAPASGEVNNLSLEQNGSPVSVTFTRTTTKWADPIKKADRIVDGNKVYTVDEIMEMYDLGAQVMAYRCKCE